MSALALLLIETADRVFDDARKTLGGALDMAVWARVEEAQLDRLLLPEANGGAGDAFVEAAEVARRFGAHSCAIPFVETLVANYCVWNAQALFYPGPKTIDSGICTTLPWAVEPVVRVTLDGRMHALPPPSLLADLGGDPVALVQARAPETSSEGRGLALYMTLTAAAIAGALERALELSIAYVKERVQFGRPIGSFQAVQHMIAQMAEETAAAVAAAQMAARRLGTPAALASAAIAKIRAGEAAAFTSRLAHQCHGAIGFTAEYPLARVTNRALAWRDRAGSETYWSERLGRAAMGHPYGLWSFLLEGTMT